MHPIQPMTTSVPCARRWRARFAPGLMAAALTVPGAVHPYSVDALLRMPLERLLQLQVTQRSTSLGSAAKVANAALAPAVKTNWEQRREA